jgi:hypothetical protein
VEPFWVVLEMKEKLYIGSIYFFPFYRKGLIGVWYYNLRNPVKATPLGHLRPGLRIKLPVFPFNVSIGRPVEITWVPRPEDWKGQVPYT